MFTIERPKSPAIEDWELLNSRARKKGKAVNYSVIDGILTMGNCELTQGCTAQMAKDLAGKVIEKVCFEEVTILSEVAAKAFFQAFPDIRALEIYDCIDGRHLLACFKGEHPIQELSIKVHGSIDFIPNKILAEFCKNGSSLFKLSLYGYSLSCYPDFVAELKNCNSLREITFAHGEINEKTRKELELAFKQMPRLQKLSLIYIGGVEKKEWQILPSKSLEFLDLHGSPSLTDALQEVDNSLIEINLANCGIQNFGDIAYLLCMGQNIQKVDLSHNPLELLPLIRSLKVTLEQERRLTMVFSGMEACFAPNVSGMISRELEDCTINLEFTGHNPFNVSIPRPDYTKGAAVKSRASVTTEALITKGKYKILELPQDLSENPVEEVKFFFSAMAELKPGECDGLRLSGCVFSASIQAAFAEGLKNAEWLHVLEIEQVEKNEFLLEALPALKHRLQHVVISPYRELGQEGNSWASERIVGALEDFLQGNEKLRSLIFKEMHFTGVADEAGARLAKALQFSRLIKLGLINCTFSHAAIGYFSQIIETMPLKRLQLQNVLEEDPIFPSMNGNAFIKKLLVDCQSGASQITSLRLKGCGIRDAAIIPSLIRKFPQLKKLDLSGNLFELESLNAAMKGVEMQLLEGGWFAGRELSIIFGGNERFWSSKAMPALAWGKSQNLQVHFTHFDPLKKTASKQVRQVQMKLGLSEEWEDLVADFDPFKKAIEERFTVIDTHPDGSCLFHAVQLAEIIKTAGSSSVCLKSSDCGQGLSLRDETLAYMRENPDDFAPFAAPPTDREMLFWSGMLDIDSSEKMIIDCLANEGLMHDIRGALGFPDANDFAGTEEEIIQRNLEMHLAILENPQMHAGELELRALSDLLKQKIVVYDEGYVALEDGQLCGMPTFGEEFTDILTLLRKGNHYQLLLTKDIKIRFEA